MTIKRGCLSDRPGMRSGLVVLVGSLVGHFGNYLFYVVAARLLGAAQFAEVTAMVAYSTIIIWPVNGLQVAVARDVARFRAAGDDPALAGLVAELLRRSLQFGVVALVVLLGISPLLRGWLDLTSAWLPAVAGLWIVLLIWLIVGTGVVQGQERFGLFAAELAGPLGLLRAALLPPFILLAGLTGSMWAMVSATAVGLVLILRPARALVTGTRTRQRFRPGAAMVSLIAFAALTNIDVLVAKAALSAEAAGLYSGAALIGKIALYAPSALALVLLPRAAGAIERGERAERGVLLTMGVTLLVGLGIAAVLAVMPPAFLELTFGAEFGAATSLLAPLALVMTMAALLNVHLIFAVARRSRQFPLLIVAASVLDAVLLLFLHRSPAEIVTATALAIGGTLLLYELGSPNGLVRMTLAVRGWARAGPPERPPPAS